MEEIVKDISGRNRVQRNRDKGLEIRREENKRTKWKVFNLNMIRLI
jgi:hypothetical protein